MNSPDILQRFEAHELRVCAWFNRACAYRLVRGMFAAISWLGDGRFWYSLMVALPLAFGWIGLEASAVMALTGLAGLGVYRGIKDNTQRLRPYMKDEAITLGASPLDHYSFPSGHTLHAVSFTLISVAYLPELAFLLVPFTLMVAASRVILGLHYPSDVALGAAIGFGLAKLALLMSDFV